MARNFSDSLNSAFAIDDTTPNVNTPQLENLAQSVSQKKAAVDSQTSELQALEARIKEKDKRLEQKRSRTSSPAGRGGCAVSGAMGGGTEEGTPYHRQPMGDTLGVGMGEGGVNAPGAAGNYYGADRAGQGDFAGRGSAVSSSRPLADRTGKMSGGAENLSASTRNQWVPTDERGEVADGSD